MHEIEAHPEMIEFLNVTNVAHTVDAERSVISVNGTAQDLVELGRAYERHVQGKKPNLHTN